jgi:hypothetical protein
MEHNLDYSIALLSRTPRTLDAWLRSLPETWTHSNEGAGTFTAYDVVGHLIYGDREDWVPRARRILEFGEAKPFDPFDRMGHVKQSEGKSLDQLLDEFSKVRAEALDQLRALNLASLDMQRRGRHPALGTVTMSELLATWAAHDLTHLHQLSRIMAHQYREAVGPWVEYLGVMKCAGHSG